VIRKRDDWLRLGNKYLLQGVYTRDKI